MKTTHDLLQDDLELEIKIQVDDSGAICKWLLENGEFLGQINQIDYYFEPIDTPFIFMDSTGFADANDWLRVRVAEKAHFICFKRCHRNEQNVVLYSDEIEIEIEDAEKMKKILFELKFREILTIKKKQDFL